MPYISLGLSLTCPILGGPSVSVTLDAPLTVADGAAPSTVIARASVNGQGGTHTFILTDDASGQFAITSGGELSVDGALTAGAHSITIRAMNGVADPVISTWTVSVTALPANTVAPAISGAPEVGDILTVSEGVWSGFPAPTFAYQWTRDGSDIAGATDASYTLVAADDETDVECDITATNTIGAGERSSNTVSVTYAAPVAANALADRSFTDDTGVQTIDTLSDFTGDNLAFSLVTSTAGVTVNSETGVVSFDTDVLAVQSGTSAVVRATNSGGNDDSGFSFTVSGVAGQSWSFTAGDGQASIDLAPNFPTAPTATAGDGQATLEAE